jgi:hypothetical protein
MVQIDGPAVHVDAIECHFAWHPILLLSACHANYTPHPEGFYVTDIELLCPAVWRDTGRCSVLYTTSYINMDQKTKYIGPILDLWVNDFAYNHFAIWAQGTLTFFSIMWYVLACTIAAFCMQIFLFCVRTPGTSRNWGRVTPDEARALAAERHPRLFANDACVDLIDILECYKDKIWKRRTLGYQSYENVVCEALAERIRSVPPLPCALRDPANAV